VLLAGTRYSEGVVEVVLEAEEVVDSLEVRVTLARRGWSWLDTLAGR